MKKCCIAILSLFSSAVSTFAQASLYREAAQQAWVDSIFQSLTLEQKIGQLVFMVAVPSDRDRDKRAALEGLLRRTLLGGLIFFRGHPDAQVAQVNRYQTPLLVGMDAEWGLHMRLDSTLRYPWAMTLGLCGIPVCCAAWGDKSLPSASAWAFT